MVQFGETTGYGRSASNSTETESHSVLISGLAGDREYHYVVVSTVLANLTSTSSDQTFSTPSTYVSNTTLMVANESTTVTVPDENITMDIVTGANVSNATITVKTSSSSQVNGTLYVPGLNKYIQVETSQDVRDAITSIILKVYYTDEELNASGLDESSLAIYWYNTTAQQWVKLSTNMSWVYGTGVNTVQNYVWANVNHFSYYSVGGTAMSCTLKGDYAPCGEVSLGEVVAIINNWAANEATIQEVVALINAWATSV